jgi:predicted Zn-ribbon and HTH transcriptional regulator
MAKQITTNKKCPTCGSDLVETDETFDVYVGDHDYAISKKPCRHELSLEPHRNPPKLKNIAICPICGARDAAYNFVEKRTKTVLMCPKCHSAKPK